MTTGRFTFTMIKPFAVSNSKTAEILAVITSSGFRIAALKMRQLSQKQAETFYEIHKERPFYKDLVAFMTSGPIIAAVLEKENAVEDYRKLMGSTDPAKADDGTLRKLFAYDIQRNAVHGSDSDENAKREISFHFSQSEIFAKDGSLINVNL